MISKICRPNSLFRKFLYYYKGYKKIENNDLPNDNFSPESGGSVKPKTAIDAIRTHGTIKLKK